MRPRPCDADWFAATVGGLGLTGLIVEAELQLRRVPGPWLDTETIAYSGLDEFFRLSDESHPAWEHAVSWIDCTSGDAVRGLFMRAKPAAGEHGTWRERRLAMPLVPPVSLVNRLTLQAAQPALLDDEQAPARPHASPITSRSCFRSTASATGTGSTARQASTSINAWCRARRDRRPSARCWRRSRDRATARCWRC